MRKLFKKTTKREKLKKLERKINKGMWPFVVKTALLFAVCVGLGPLFFNYVIGSRPITIENATLAFFINLIFGVPMGFFLWSQLKKDHANLKKTRKLGAWGTGIFEDDIACDLIETTIHKNQPIDALVVKALSTLNHDRLACQQGYEVIVACAMSHAIINKVSYSEIDDLDTWLAKQDATFTLHHKQDLVKALKRVLGDQSDLNEIWSENKAEYSAWRGNIEALIESLAKNI